MVNLIAAQIVAMLASQKVQNVLNLAETILSVYKIVESLFSLIDKFVLKTASEEENRAPKMTVIAVKHTVTN